MVEHALVTERSNPISQGIDSKSTMDILRIINAEDRKVPYAVEKALPRVAAIVDDVVAAFRQGGRLIYIGAGTSGRLGVLDASECPPTYGVPPTMVQGIIAGGRQALTSSIEWAEDDGQAGIDSLKNIDFSRKDVLVGITASGGAPFVVEAMRYALGLGAKVGAISCNEDVPVFSLLDEDHRVYVPVGPEVVAGSTRMKAGTAQKLVLNMITTASMIRLGKVYNNLMVDLLPLNEKLVHRSRRLISTISGCSPEAAAEYFEQAGKNTKTAIVMALLRVDAGTARDMLKTAEGSISRTVAQNTPPVTGQARTMGGTPAPSTAEGAVHG